MPEEKVTIELDRSVAIAVVEALSNCGDDIAEQASLEIRNSISDVPKAVSFYWSDNEENELRLYAEEDTAVVIQVRDMETGKWQTMIDMAEQNFDDPTIVVLDQLTSMMLGGDGDEDEDE